MATLYSTEYTKDANGRGMKVSADHAGGVVCKHANFTGAMTTSDILHVMKIPAGARILGISTVKFSAHETSTTLDVGFGAHTALTDGSAVAADDDHFVAAKATSSAGYTMFSAEALEDGGYLATGDFVLTANINAGSLLSSDTIDFFIYFFPGMC